MRKQVERKRQEERKANQVKIVRAEAIRRMEGPMHEDVALVYIEKDVPGLGRQGHAHDKECHGVQDDGESKNVQMNSQKQQTIHQTHKYVHPQNKEQATRLAATRHRLRD